jgi:F-type H+-transporting ATPase subunit b
MKKFLSFNKGKKRCICFIILLSLSLWCGEALAAEGSGGWRPTYDLVLRYINFLILAFLIIKYARKPLVNFFKEKSQDVKKEIQQIEIEKNEVQNQVKALLDAREKNKEKLEQLKDRILSQGKAKQKRIVDDAVQESRLLLENTHQKLENRILKAKNALRTELVDMAIDLATKKLPEEITDQDNQRFVDHYLQSTQAIHHHLE